MICGPALLACAPPALVLADARPPALLACAPDALVLADTRAPALLALAPLALVLADARLPALLALAPLALVWADPALAEAPLQKTEFTQQEWDAFGVDGLRMHHFVKSGDSFFHPAGCYGSAHGGTQPHCAASSSRRPPPRRPLREPATSRYRRQLAPPAAGAAPSCAPVLIAQQLQVPVEERRDTLGFAILPDTLVKAKARAT